MCILYVVLPAVVLVVSAEIRIIDTRVCVCVCVCVRTYIYIYIKSNICMYVLYVLM